MQAWEVDVGLQAAEGGAAKEPPANAGYEATRKTAMAEGSSRGGGVGHIEGGLGCSV